MFDVVTFGSATRDIFLKANDFLVGDYKFDQMKKKISLPYGLKVDVKDLYFRSGGGGSNSAATFSAQGLKTVYCGAIGSDPEGEAVFKDLKDKKIETKFIFRTDKKPTNVSVIFSTPQERTILVYKGSSSTLGKDQIPWRDIRNTKWFYLAPLSDKLNSMFGTLVKFAKDNRIKVMANPGSSQLEMPPKTLHPILKKIDILLVNQEEAQTLAKNQSIEGEKLVKALRNIFSGILIITNGEEKFYASSNNTIYFGTPGKVKVLDKTGAGDAFGSGFLAEYMRSRGDIVRSLQFADSNSTSCLKKWGAKEGILKKNQSFKKIKIQKRKIK